MALTAPRAVSYGASIKGEDHKENEDTILVDDRLGLYAIADGVTMPYGGGPASRLTISSLRSLFKGDLAETIPQVNRTVLEEKKKSLESGPARSPQHTWPTEISELLTRETAPPSSSERTQ